MNLQSTIPLHTGRRMPVMGLGTWGLSQNTAETVEYALRLGYRLIDTSGDYGTQPGIGEGINAANLERDELFVTTKVEETEDAYEATRKNIKELQLEYADLMLIHRPPRGGVGERLWQGLLRAKQEGLTRDIGVSNYSIEQLQTLIDSSHEVPVVNQIEWSPFGHSDDMLDFCHDHHIVIQAYSPLTRSEKLHDRRIEEMATRYKKTPAQLLIRWNLQLGSVPLVKANRREHLQEDADVFDFSISDEDMTVLNNYNEYFSSIGHLAYA